MGTFCGLFVSSGCQQLSSALCCNHKAFKGLAHLFASQPTHLYSVCFAEANMLKVVFVCKSSGVLLYDSFVSILNREDTSDGSYSKNSTSLHVYILL